MRISNLLVMGSLIAIPLFTMPEEVFAMPPNDWKVSVAAQKLEPWFKSIQQRVMADSKFNNYCHSTEKPVQFAIELKTDGQIADFKVLQSSGSPETDKAALELVRKAAPFKAPPNDFPYKNGLWVVFDSSHNSVQFSLLNRRWQNGNRFY